MLVHEILEEVRRRGVSLFPIGDRIRFYPKNTLTSELLEELLQVLCRGSSGVSVTLVVVLRQ